MKTGVHTLVRLIVICTGMGRGGGRRFGSHFVGVIAVVQSGPLGWPSMVLTISVSVNVVDVDVVGVNVINIDYLCQFLWLLHICFVPRGIVGAENLFGFPVVIAQAKEEMVLLHEADELVHDTNVHPLRGGGDQLL